MRRAIAILVALYLIFVLVDKFVLVELLVRRTAIPVLLAIASALAAAGAGFLARRLQRDLALNLVVGYPIFGAICFLVALLKISPWTMVPVVGILGGIGLLSSAKASQAVDDARRARRSTFAVIALALIGVAAFIAAQAPPSTLDELAYHLAVPWTWVKEGRAIDLPLVSHSYFPLGIESADLPLLSILGTAGGGIASHFLHLLAAVAVVALLLRRTRDCPILTAAIAATPALALTAGWSLVDWPLLGVSLALADAEEDATFAAALGAGLLTKYTFIPIAIIVCVWAGRSRPDRLKPVRTLGTGIAIGSIFFLRNLMLTGNPIAPFLGALAPHVAHYRAGAFVSDYIFSGGFIDESLGASMLIACVLTAGALAWLLAAAGAALFFLAPSARLLVPFFAIPASRATIPNRWLRGLIAIAIAVQLLLIAFFTERSQAFALIAGRAYDDQYLAAVRPSTTTIAAIDSALPERSLTLIIGLSETYWFQHRVRGGGNFDGPRVSAYLDAGSSDALAARLKRDGITHIAVIAAPVPTTDARKLEERETALSDGAKRTLAQLLDRYAGGVTQHGNATLFALK
ncbi:MAG TPA: hypothetical protein VL284_18770 [Thermoanaerobaculia bacterium]|nr:hypothetical protein [Thermoanaerobaculia bacterium]